MCRARSMNFSTKMSGLPNAANDSRLATAECDTAEGEFAVSLQVPPDVVGPCHVRIYVSGVRDFAMGARDIRITPSATLQRRANSQTIPARRERNTQ